LTESEGIFHFGTTKNPAKENRIKDCAEIIPPRNIKTVKPNQREYLWVAEWSLCLRCPPPKNSRRQKPEKGENGPSKHV
jgi:hypothetical protein